MATKSLYHWLPSSPTNLESLSSTTSRTREEGTPKGSNMEKKLMEWLMLNGKHFMENPKKNLKQRILKAKSRLLNKKYKS
jgi:hypothetical protein